ncbi:hypothetical protein K7X08_013854 [Anisodus acutangulus]|uniref:non-specific serine/threonine protein kinase n=1 Tax=Anisodus acutangulus TaxID=402998 RepID=A0A9Q1R3S1_9SOLA|nr:hypothetical protein K7X08_013854 [Anisodus acutangulus]
MLRWTFLVYVSLTTDNDVVLFVKGLNNRQGINREPNEFNCIFGYDEGNMVIRTNVTSSMQEVFRCNRPDPTLFGKERVMVSIEVVLPTRVVVPSVAYYNVMRKLENNEKTERARLCACTMVYNVGKFLKEWVLYHSRIGVEKFVLYDNASDDDLGRVVDELVQEGYDVKTYFWLWPKTQEAGFSHSAIYAKDSCAWMMYIDVDEFVYSPLWTNVSRPSKTLLHSLLPNPKNLEDPSIDTRQVAEISIPCYEFGPSNRRFHPITGVTQGYNCRRKMLNRHKSIVLLDAVDHSLLNVIHHFILKQGYKSKKVNVHDMAVNHYKFQAWPEFKAKFRRRVSAYVIDWTKELNPHSNDRTPGLGFSPVEPKGNGRKEGSSKGKKSGESNNQNSNVARSFAFKELALATQNFRETNLIGEGGFGSVYKGRLDSGLIVAIKQLNLEGLQGNQEFVVEVLMLSLMHHENLVNLIGYCTHGEQRLLVYEFMSKGSLENHIFDLEPGMEPLNWKTRLKIAAGAAHGLEYLHKANPPVIYRDLKSSNILLDSEFNPKLSDFGLAKLGPVGDNTHVSTRVMGTYGYCAPEYAMTGKLTLKSDIYSFGVVLLELITGRKAYDTSKKPGEQNLVVWSIPFLKDRRKYVYMVDPALDGQFSSRCLHHAVAITAMCLQEQASFRPSITDIVTALDYLVSQAQNSGQRKGGSHSGKQMPSSSEDFNCSSRKPSFETLAVTFKIFF